MSVVRVVVFVAVTVFAALGIAGAQSLPAVSTIAGTGAFGMPGGPLATSPFMEPFGTAVAANGTIYVSDYAAQRIVQIDLVKGVVRTVAGSGAVDASGLHVEGGFLDGPALSARFNGPAGIAVDGDSLLIADSQNHCVRRLEGGVVSTIAGLCFRTFPEQSRQFHPLLLGLFGRAHIAPVDLWSDFIREERRPDARPLFGSFDAHFTARGRAVTADAVYRALSAAI